MLTAIAARAGAFLASLWAKLALFAVGIAAALAVYAAIRRGGRDAERADARGKILNDVKVRHEVETDVGRLPDPADELRKHWSRD